MNWTFIYEPLGKVPSLTAQGTEPNGSKVPKTKVKK